MQQSASSNPLVLSGRVSLAPVGGAIVNVYTLNPEGGREFFLASVVTTGSGDFQATIPSVTAPLLLVASGGQYNEEAGGAAVSLGSQELLAAINPRLGSQSVAITPLSHIAAPRALDQTTRGVLDLASAISTTNRQMAKAVGLTDVADITQVIPARPDTTLATQDLLAGGREAKVALALAALSRVGQLNAQSSLEVTRTLAGYFQTHGAFDASAWSTQMTQAENEYLTVNPNVFNSSSMVTFNANPVADNPALVLVADGAVGSINTFGLNAITGRLQLNGRFDVGGGAGFTALRCAPTGDVLLAVHSNTGSQSLVQYQVSGAGALSPTNATTLNLTSVARLLWDIANGFVYLMDYQTAALQQYAFALPAGITAAPVDFHLDPNSEPVDAQVRDTTVFILETEPSQILVLDTSSGGTLLTVPLPGTLPTGLRLRLEPTGQFLYVITEEGDGSTSNLLTYHWTGAALDLLAMRPLGGSAGPLALTRDGRFLLLASVNDGRIMSFRLDPLTGAATPAGLLILDDGVQGVIAGLSVDPLGQTLFVSGGRLPAGTPGFVDSIQIDSNTGALRLSSVTTSATNLPGEITTCAR